MQAVVTHYRNLTRWDIKNYLWLFQSPYPVESLGKYIYEHSEKENISAQKDKDFPILGVTNKEGVYLNEYVKGKDINQPYKKVKRGELTYNPYRVNVGSIGIVQDEYDGFYISPAYVVFGTKEGLLNEYIYLVLSSSWFNPYLRAATSGSVRQNLTFELLFELKVPIPPLKVQQKIVEKWRKTQNEAQELRTGISKKKKEIEDYILSELVIGKKRYEKCRGAFVIKFKNVERWGVGYNDYARQGLLDFRSKYPIINLDKVITRYQYGTSEKANENNGVPILRMNNIIDGELDSADLKYIVLDQKTHQSLSLYKGDFLFNRTNSKELVGKAAVFSLDGDFVFASYLIRLKFDNQQVMPEYVNHLFNSPIIRNQINAISRQIIGQANINTGELGGFKIPLPTTDKQKEIVDNINRMRSEIFFMKDKVEKLLENTKQEIGKMLKR